MAAEVRRVVCVCVLGAGSWELERFEGVYFGDRGAVA